MTQNVFAIAVVLVVLLPAAWWVSHTRLVAARSDVAGSWADVDAELQRRHELVPHLIEAVRSAAVHEQELLVDLAARNDDATRSPDTPEAATRFECPLTEAIERVVSLRERHPSLNSQRNFLELHQQLAITEDRIAAARRYYNTRVERLNRRVEAFPSAIVASRHGFTRAAFFET
ncbi:MAG: LemA family protein [Ilumatobacteraceae bacterium]